MHLISLEANQATFHPVSFNPTGLSIIIGKQHQVSQGEDIQHQNSSNGVGKSLLLYIISYCLGSEPNASFASELRGWVFSLTFGHDGKTYKVARSCESQRQVQINEGQPISLNDYREWLQNLVTPASVGIKNLTFRSILAPFLRQGKESYVSYGKAAKKEGEFAQLIRTVYLLGLDVKLASEKSISNEEKKQLGKLKASFDKDRDIKQYFLNGKDPGQGVMELTETLKELVRKRSEFQVAENFTETIEKSETVKKELNEIRNLVFDTRRRLTTTNSAISAKIELSNATILRIYNEVKDVLGAEYLKSFDEVSDFHSKLLESRRNRLRSEAVVLRAELSGLEEKLRWLEAEKNQLSGYLETHGALNELLALEMQINDINAKLSKITDFKKLQQSIKNRESEIKKRMLDADSACAEYLTSEAAWINRIQNLFEELARSIYPQRTSQLTIKSKDGFNAARYQINVKLESDSSDGVGGVGIFVFDFLVLLLQRNHEIRFLCHDNRLFPEIDPRQRSAVLRAAKQFSEQYGCQYILTANEDHLQGMRVKPGTAEGFTDLLSAEEYTQIIENNTVLSLNDNDARSKLLGISVELNYDNRGNA